MVDTADLSPAAEKRVGSNPTGSTMISEDATTFSDDPKYPNIDVQLTGIDSNAFSIMGTVADALRKGGVPREEINQYRIDSMSGDYDNVLQTAMAWVNVY